MWKIPCHWICIPTNGIVKDDGFAVMGKGVALDATQKFWDLPGILGELLKSEGNNVHLLKRFGRSEYVPQNPLYYDKFVAVSLFAFPTKHHYRDNSDIDLIEKSCQQLKKKWDIECNRRERELYDTIPCIPTVVLPKVGTGLGGLDWDSVVKPILSKYFLSDDFIIAYK